MLLNISFYSQVNDEASIGIYNVSELSLWQEGNDRSDKMSFAFYFTLIDACATIYHKLISYDLWSDRRYKNKKQF